MEENKKTNKISDNSRVSGENSFTMVDLPINDKNEQKNGNKPENGTDLEKNDKNTTEKTDDNLEDTNCLSRFLLTIRKSIKTQYTQYNRQVTIALIVALLILFHIYLGFAVAFHINNGTPIAWCDGIGFLIVLYGIGVWCAFYYVVLKRLLGRYIKQFFGKIAEKLIPIWKKRFVQLIAAAIVIGAIIMFLIVDARKQPRRLISALGIVVFVFIGLLLSKYPGHVKWKQVLWSIGLQFVFGLLILRWETGNAILNCVSVKVRIFLEFTAAGTDLIYGYLSSGKPIWDDSTLTFPPILAFRALCVIFFFGFVISLLYYYGVMQWMIAKMGWLLQVTIGTTAAESMNAAANIFVGLSEAPLMIKPFLNDLTNSELNAVMTGGFSTIAGTVMALYIDLGIPAEYLLSACVMAAPCALGMSKLIFPETKESKTLSKNIKLYQVKNGSNAVDAAAQGAMAGVVLISCIIANIIAFVSFVTFLNAVFTWLGNLVGIEGLTFEWLLGQCFVPVAFMLGVDNEEVGQVGLLLGLRTVSNEFIAYGRLVGMDVSPRTRAIASYALCSFSNIGSVGIQIGGLGSLLDPERRKDLAKTIGYSFLGGTLVGFLNACIAGALLSAPGYDEWQADNMRL